MEVIKTIENLKRRGFAVEFFDTKKQAAEYLVKNIRNATVGIGGSTTIEQLDIYDQLCENNQVLWRKKTPTTTILQEISTLAIYI